MTIGQDAIRKHFILKALSDINKSFETRERMGISEIVDRVRDKS